MKLFLTLLLSFLLTPPLYAQNSYSEFERGLNLSDAQRRRAEGVREKYVEEWRSQRQEAMRRRIELRELRRNQSFDREKSARLEQELMGIERSRRRSYENYQSELGQVLNPKQREQYNSFAHSEKGRFPVSPRPGGGYGIRGYGMQGQGPEMRGRTFEGPRLGAPMRQGPEPRGKTGWGREMKRHER
jgi:hypothetical protein